MRRRFRGAAAAAVALLSSCFWAEAVTAAESAPSTDARWPRHLGQLSAHAGAALAGADEGYYLRDRGGFYGYGGFLRVSLP